MTGPPRSSPRPDESAGAILDAAPDAIVVADPDGRILRVNARAAALSGYAPGDLIGRPIDLLVPTPSKPSPAAAPGDLVPAPLRALAAGTGLLLHRRDGTCCPVDVLVSEVVIDGRLLLVASLRDGTESRRSAQRLAQLSRTHDVLAETTQLIVRERDPQTLLNGACRIAVEHGGFPMAWIGQIGGDGELAIVAHAGAAPDTLAVIARLFDDPDRRCAFTMRALSGGRLAVCHDIAGDPLAQPWRDAALSRGYRSMVSLPLTAAGRRIGVFNLYASEPGALDDDALRLLESLARNIGFAIEVTERARGWQRAEAALQASEERVHALEAQLRSAHPVSPH